MVELKIFYVYKSRRKQKSFAAASLYAIII